MREYIACANLWAPLLLKYLYKILFVAPLIAQRAKSPELLVLDILMQH